MGFTEIMRHVVIPIAGSFGPTMKVLGLVGIKLTQGTLQRAAWPSLSRKQERRQSTHGIHTKQGTEGGILGQFVGGFEHYKLKGMGKKN